MKKRNFREKLADMIDVSKDVILDTYLIRITGNRELIIQNHKGIIEYNDRVIRIKAKPHSVSVFGKELELKNISDNTLSIFGFVEKITLIESVAGKNEN